MMFKQEGTPADWKEIEEWMQKQRSGAAANQPQRLHFRFIEPGAILPPGTPVQPPMPNNMSININRNGNEPAKITIKRNDQKWEIFENELDKLPADVRPYVERMLGHGNVQMMTFGGGGSAGGAAAGVLSAEALDFTIPAPPPGMPGAPGPQMQVQPTRSLEDRLEELNRKIDQLEKDLHEQWGRHSPPTQSEKSSPETKPEPNDESAQ
jgi:hypothetical protein